jgi:AcrR family transcriptional regulator
VLASQRGRLLDAMAQAVAEHGYGNTTIAHVVSHAGVSRKTFYDHFADKRDCFLAMYDTGIMFLLGRIAETIEGQDDPHSRLVVGLQAFLTILSAEPAFCRAIIIEVHAAGPEALARRRAVLRVFAERYLDANRQARKNGAKIAELSEDRALAVVGGILDLVSTRVEAGRTAKLSELADELTAFAVHNVLARK